MFDIRPIMCDPRLASIVTVQAIGLISNISFLFFLPDNALVIVVAVISAFGVVSAAVSSNVTAKIYAGTSSRDNSGDLSKLTLRLLFLEQVAALVVCSVLLNLNLVAFEGIEPHELYLLGVFASCASLSAFTKYKDTTLIKLNYIRAVASASRTILIHILVFVGLLDYVIVVVIVSLVPVFLYVLNVTLKVSQKSESGLRLSPWVTTREYVFGVPASLIRSVFDQGVTLVALEVLNPQDLRIFRFLILPRDIFNRLFNAALPVIFNSLYAYSLNVRQTFLILFGVAAMAVLWYWMSVLMLGSGWGSVLSFMLYLSLNAAVYSVLPIMWRVVYKNRAGYTLLAICFTALVSGFVYLMILPQSISGIFFVMSSYSLSYIVAMCVIMRMEKVELDRGEFD